MILACLITYCNLLISIFIVSVDSCVPGDLVTVTGIVDVTSSEESKLAVLHFEMFCLCYFLSTYNYFIILNF